MARDTEPGAVDTRARKRRRVRVEVQRQATARLGLQSARGRRGSVGGPDQFHLECRGTPIHQERGSEATRTGADKRGDDTAAGDRVELLGEVRRTASQDVVRWSGKSKQSHVF